MVTLNLSVAYICFEVALNLFLNQLYQTLFWTGFFLAQEYLNLIKLKPMPNQDKRLIIFNLKKHFSMDL